MTRLEDHVAALRELGDGGIDDGADARARLRSALDRSRAPARLASLGVAAAVLLVAGGAWGFATGRIPLWRTESISPSPSPSPISISTPNPSPTPILSVSPTPTAPPPPSPPPPSPEPIRPSASASALAPTPSQLYSHAYSLYFHDHDYPAALAALDDYLTREPHGQFVVEAQYNRALCLVHLGRLADARLALSPFANSLVTPPGYRQREATQLIDRIDRNSMNGAP